MVRKSVKTEKTSKRGKGDVKQSVKVSVKIGETKPKRKRAYRRKAKGESDLARTGETKTFYGNLPPPPPQQIVYTPQLPPAFQNTQKQERNVSGLLEDVKRERTNLLEDIKREISSQVIKAQGAEQRGELAKEGAFDPFNVKEYAKPQYNINQRIEATAPTFTEIKQKPLIEEISSTPFLTIKRKKGQKNLVMTHSSGEEGEGFKYRVPLGRGTEIPKTNITEYKVQEPLSQIINEPKKLPKKQLRTLEREAMTKEDVNVSTA